jgi:hypothetical protein
MGMRIVLTVCFVFSASYLIAFHEHHKEIAKIAQKVDDQENYVKSMGQLIIMGNAPIESANIVILPEVHDDPKSLMTQLLLIAQEKNKARPFIVLDESLPSMQKSMWDVFSQKALEIVAAKDQRRQKQNYIPSRFEMALQSLAAKFKTNYRQLHFLNQMGIYALSHFSKKATPFYGWDTKTKSSLTDRNVKMVETLKLALKKHDRILVMAGARHVPELEFFSSQKLLCQNSQFKNIDQYFSTIKSKFGKHPMLRFGIGATAPIHNFLSSQRYVVVFQQDFYKELDKVIQQFKAMQRPQNCLEI